MPTIHTTANCTLAAVAAIGGVKQGEYGPYQSVLLVGSPARLVEKH